MRSQFNDQQRGYQIAAEEEKDGDAQSARHNRAETGVGQNNDEHRDRSEAI